MSENYKNYTDQLWDLGKKFAEESGGAWERYARMAGGSQNPEQLRQRVTEFWQVDTPGYMRQLMQLQLDYYMNVMKVGMEFNNALLDSVFQGKPCPPQEPATSGTSTTPPPTDTPNRSVATDIHFEGKPGETLCRPFVVANREPRDIAVSFEISEFVCQDGDSIGDAKIEFHPAAFTLSCDEEQVVECHLVLDDRFQAGNQYAAMARVVGFPNMLLRLILDVT